MQSALLLPFRIVGRLDPYRMVGQPKILWDQQQNAAGVGGYAGWEDVPLGWEPYYSIDRAHRLGRAPLRLMHCGHVTYRIFTPLPK